MNFVLYSGKQCNQFFLHKAQKAHKLSFYHSFRMFICLPVCTPMDSLSLFTDSTDKILSVLNPDILFGSA